jgi:NADP-reducing hydrogenase subunit HndB
MSNKVEKINSFENLKQLKEKLKSESFSGGNLTNGDNLVLIKVALATCSIATGALKIYQFFKDELEKRGITAVIKKTGCMGCCYAEPTVEITLPGSNPVIFGNVNLEKADEIIERYIKNKELVEGTLQISFQSIDNI